MRRIFDESQLMDVLRKWQNILRLDAWDIRIKLCRQSEMLDPNVQGENNWTLATRQSVIHVLNPVDYPNDTEFEQDMEQTVVHELLHLHFAPFEPEDTTSREYLSMEQAIDLLAQADLNTTRQEIAHIQDAELRARKLYEALQSQQEKSIHRHETQYLAFC